GFFERHDGTSSFFVSDFTEVDNNVTRHVPEELARSDWNAMIMHYLGLDHIGHKTGPQGPNMPAKQKEMDGIVREIYEAMEKDESHKNTLLVLAGDHGMNAGGNHGGSGPGETEPALLFASPKLKTRRSKKDYLCPTEPREGTDYHFYRKVEQSDIVPTFAGLMGLPISKNSLGVFMAEFYGLWTDAKKGAQLAHQNAKQIRHIVEAAYGPASFHRQVEKWEACYAATRPDCEAASTEEEELAAMWAQANLALQASLKAQNPDWHALGELFTGFTLAAQNSLSSVASSYDMSKMICGILFSAASLGLTILSFRHVWPPSAAGVFLGLTSSLYGVMMFASSYVEEEQHFWYWLTPACMVIMSVVILRKPQGTERRVTVATAALVIIAVHRVVERWNQTGQKHTGAPDIVHGFFPRHFVLMWMLILITYGYICYALARRTFLDLIAPEAAVVLAVAIVVPALVFKLNFTQADAPELVQGLAYKIREWTASFSLVGQAQVAFALQFLAAIMVVFMA
ncbi:alkaline phosphatase-like protein, partial [Hortaea werneckii]